MRLGQVVAWLADMGNGQRMLRWGCVHRVDTDEEETEVAVTDLHSGVRSLLPTSVTVMRMPPMYDHDSAE